MTDRSVKRHRRIVIPVPIHSGKCNQLKRISQRQEQQTNNSYQQQAGMLVLLVSNTFVWIAIRSYMRYWLFVRDVIEIDCTVGRTNVNACLNSLYHKETVSNLLLFDAVESRSIIALLQIMKGSFAVSYIFSYFFSRVVETLIE